MNMIEKMARELCKKSGNDPDKIMTDYECDTWPLWVDYQELAKAALECLKEPTEGMIEYARENSEPPYGWKKGAILHRHIIMINAALEGK